MSHEISTENIVDAQSQHYKSFEKNRINLGGTAHKTFGARTFFTDTKNKEVIIFIPDLALTYKKMTNRNNILVVFEDKPKSVVFVFADTPNILGAESCLKTEIYKDSFYESNIKQIKETMLFFCGAGRQIDVLCEKKDIEKIKKIPPFGDENIYFILPSDAKKIAIKMTRFESNSFKIRKYLIVSAILLLPCFVANSFFVKSIEDKTKAAQVEKMNKEARFYALKAELDTLKKDELYTQAAYYQSLAQKKVLK